MPIEKLSSALDAIIDTDAPNRRTRLRIRRR